MQSNSQRIDQLVELAEIIAEEIDVCESARDIAALARQYRETIREIDEIKGGEDSNDDVANLIRNRKSATNQ